eukprot:2395972-Pyramimonas_sp.AAC.1
MCSEWRGARVSADVRSERAGPEWHAVVGLHMGSIIISYRSRMTSKTTLKANILRNPVFFNNS